MWCKRSRGVSVASGVCVNQVFVIAEAGVNHNGSIDLAFDLIDAAAEAGADAVKFQTFSAEMIAAPDAEKAEYQKAVTDADENQFEMLRRLELTRDEHLLLKSHSESREIEFMSTAFDPDSLRFLIEECGVKRIKIPSGEITNPYLLVPAARSGLPMILSTGMATLNEIDETLGLLIWARQNSSSAFGTRAEYRAAFENSAELETISGDVTLLHCTTAYPTPPEEVRLGAMKVLGDRYHLPIGYSDHTQGIAISSAAAALGALVIEKHFTLDRGLAGPDHQASLEPAELKEMVDSVRAVVDASMGDEKGPTCSEEKNLSTVRRGLVAARHIRKGEVFDAECFAARRPAHGISPMAVGDLFGRTAERDFALGEPIL